VGLIIIGLAAIKFLTGWNSGEAVTVIPSAVNFPAPDIALNDLDGKTVNLADYRQNIVLINNWATWCPPCRSEMPALVKYFNAHADQGFILFGINAGDAPADVAKYASDNHISFPILLDPNTKTLIDFHNDSLPSSYVIDHQGYVVLAWTGPISRDMLEKYLTPLLGQ
jgi:peroxiredoxin